MKSREGMGNDADDLPDEMVKTARQRTEELGKVDDLSPQRPNCPYPRGFSTQILYPQSKS